MPTKPTRSIRLLVMSDIHGEFSRFAPSTMPPGREIDAVLIAGDFTNVGDRRPAELASAVRWMEALRDRYPIVGYVTGNHDFGMSRYFDGLSFRPDATHPGTVADLELAEGAESGAWRLSTKRGGLGLRVVGINLSPCFNAPELKAAWTNMTVDPAVDAAAFEALPAAEIVVSHAPPLTWLDSAGGGRNGYRHIGSPGLLAYIQRHKPKLVICGHVHEARGYASYEHDDGSYTDIFNVARMWRVIELDAAGNVLSRPATGDGEPT